MDIVITVGIYHSIINYLNTVPTDYPNDTIVNLYNDIIAPYDLGSIDG